jgi:hypothetical protein
MKVLRHKFNIERLRNSVDDLMRNYKLHPYHGQLCFTHTKEIPEGESSLFLGCGSKRWRWGEKPWDDRGELVPRDTPLKENDFTDFNEDFKTTYFYDMYLEISEYYDIGRMRLMMIPPKKCLSWHIDDEERIHVPVITDTSCRLVIEDEAYYLPANGSSYLCNVTVPHTAFNGHNKMKRFNILFNVIGYKNGSETLLKGH